MAGRIAGLRHGIDQLYNGQSLRANRFRIGLLAFDIADIIVILSLFVHVLAQKITFLRVLRALRLLRSYRVIRESGPASRSSDVTRHCR